jgi:hypothetical protein
MLQCCPACRGKKDVMGAGMIFHKCKICLGVGHVEDDPIPEVVTNEEIEAPKVKTGKRRKIE